MVVRTARAPVGSPPAFRLVTLAASAGGLPALAAVLARLPPEFPLPIAVVQHVDPNHRSLVADILGRRTSLRVKPAAEDDTLAGGIVYVAPPGSHMIVDPDRTIRLTDTAPIHFLRPAADLLFETAA